VQGRPVYFKPHNSSTLFNLIGPPSDRELKSPTTYLRDLRDIMFSAALHGLPSPVQFT
jgi:hypothetical protein